MIKNIVFDLGNVLLDFKPDNYLEKIGFKDSKKDKLKRVIFKTDEWLMLDRGTITQDKAVKKWQQKNPELKTEIKKVMAEWEKMLSLKEDSLEILKSLASENYNLYVLSNFHHKAFNYVYDKYDFFKYFDGLLISADINLIKPEAEIYEHLLNEFNLKGAETLFIDDSKANIKAALKEGIRVIHFKDANSLKNELELYLKE